MLDTIGRDNFDVVITHDDVVHGKPDPEPYAHCRRERSASTPATASRSRTRPRVPPARPRPGCVVFAVPSEVDLSRLTGVTHVASLTDVDVEFLRKAVEAGDHGGGGGR